MAITAGKGIMESTVFPLTHLRWIFYVNHMDNLWRTGFHEKEMARGKWDHRLPPTIFFSKWAFLQSVGSPHEPFLANDSWSRNQIFEALVGLETRDDSFLPSKVQGKKFNVGCWFITKKNFLHSIFMYSSSFIHTSIPIFLSFVSCCRGPKTNRMPPNDFFLLSSLAYSLESLEPPFLAVDPSRNRSVIISFLPLHRGSMNSLGQ